MKRILAVITIGFSLSVIGCGGAKEAFSKLASSTPNSPNGTANVSATTTSKTDACTSFGGELGTLTVNSPITLAVTGSYPVALSSIYSNFVFVDGSIVGQFNISVSDLKTLSGGQFTTQYINPYTNAGKVACMIMGFPSNVTHSFSVGAPFNSITVPQGKSNFCAQHTTINQIRAFQLPVVNSEGYGALLNVDGFSIESIQCFNGGAADQSSVTFAQIQAAFGNQLTPALSN
jgi:hypothetical protein